MYAELHCLSNFSFLRGASHPEELVARAAGLGCGALALTDECSVAGVVRAHLKAREVGIKLLIGAEFAIAGGPRVVLLAPDRAAYGDLCEIITLARRNAKKGAYRLTREDLAAHASRCLALWLPEQVADPDHLEVLRRTFPGRLWIAVELPLTGCDAQRLAGLQALGAHLAVPCVAAGGVEMHERSRKRLHDVLTAIRLGTTVEAAGLALAANGERCLHSRATLSRRYPPALLAETMRVAERCTFSLDELRYEYPDEIVPAGETPASYLRRLTEEGMRRRWPGGAPEKVRDLVEHELVLIAELGYEPYFLTVYDAVRYARSRGIYCQGRGSAANSAVCFCLGITEVDPDRIQTLFERFISKERNEPPDIDVDFEHERREEVIQYIYAKYGRGRAALAATVITYRTRSAVRDVAKALGFSLDQVDRLAKNFQWWDDPSSSAAVPSAEEEADPGADLTDRSKEAAPLSSLGRMGGGERAANAHSPAGKGRGEQARTFPAPALPYSSGEGGEPGRARRAHSVFAARLREAGFDPENPRLKQLAELVGTLHGFPRHLSQHVGGFVIARDSLARLVPIENAAMAERTVIQWDKNDIDALGLLKVDCLGLGMLTVLRKAFDLIGRHRGDKLTPATVPPEDPRVYEMIGHADTVGVFQIESRAQMSMLPRLKPKNFYDLVIEIAIVRPGPIQGNMVHPYLRRRQGIEPENYPSPEVKAVLGRTLGVPIFQEQVIKLAMVAAGFSGGEADGLRRAMAAWHRRGGLEPYERRLIEGMRAHGYSEEFARRIFEQIKGFGEYGFPESHSASFALLAYVSAWLKCYEPAAFLAAVLNSQPMGFYQPSQLVQDARRHGVEVRPADVCASDWDCTLEPALAAGEPAPTHLSGGHTTRAFARGFDSPRTRAAGAGKEQGKEVPAGVALAVRLGLRQVKGLSRAGAERLMTARSNAMFVDVADMVRRAALDRRDRDALASGGALKRLAGHRHRAHWAVAGIESQRPLLADAPIPEAVPLLRAPTEAEDIVADYARVGLTLGRHPLALLRERLAARRSLSAGEISALPHGSAARTTGIVVCRQHPGSANGVIFLTLEDETGNTNIIVWPNLVERYRRTLVQASLLAVEGEVQREGEVLHLVARRLEDCSFLLGELVTRSRDFR